MNNFLGFGANGLIFERCGISLFPSSKCCLYSFGVVGKFRMRKNGVSDLIMGDIECAISPSLALAKEQRFKGWIYFPIVLQLINIMSWNTAVEMRFNVLDIFGFLAVYVTGNVEVICI